MLSRKFLSKNDTIRWQNRIFCIVKNAQKAGKNGWAGRVGGGGGAEGHGDLSRVADGRRRSRAG